MINSFPHFTKDQFSTKLPPKRPPSTNIVCLNWIHAKLKFFIGIVDISAYKSAMVDISSVISGCALTYNGQYKNGNTKDFLHGDKVFEIEEK